MSAERTVKLIKDDTEINLPLYTDNVGKEFIDIRTLFPTTKMRVYDPGYANTAVCRSAVSLVDGTEGKLLYRGYRVEDLAEYCTFLEVAYLLLHGKLPSDAERQRFSNLFNHHSLIHEDMRFFFRGFPENSHPMAVLSAMVVSLSSFYPELVDTTREEVDITAARLISKVRTIAAFSYKKSVGRPFVYPSSKLDFCSNFLNMMFSSPVHEYELDSEIVRAMNQLLIIHADHSQNCSTTTVRQVGSAGANLYASISAGICALWGPLHGGANQHVVEMLQQIHDQGLDLDAVLDRAADKENPFRIMGVGHRIYKTYDPRAKIAKGICNRVLNRLGVNDPLLELAVKLEEKIMAHSYFQERNLFPNVDYYTGITYRAMGFPVNMYTVLFALGRLPGWIAQWVELRDDPEQKIGRPNQLYTGEKGLAFVPRSDR